MERFGLKAKTVGVLATENEDIRSLRELITYGLKGLAAYTKHANALLNDDEKLDAFLQSALAKTLDDSLTVDELVALTLEVGKYGVQGMADLDAANTTAYGNPEITSVDIGVRNNPGILISGHDLKDLEKCYLRIIIRSSKSIRISQETTAMRGGSRKRNLRALTVRC